MTAYKLGALKDKEDGKDHLYGNTMHSIDLPSVVDHQPFMSIVKSQGARSACVAFALCAIKEYQEIRQRNFRGTFDLSEEFLYSFIQEEGGGAYPRNACEVLRKIGVATEEQYPWNKYIKSDLERLETPDKKDKLLYRTAKRLAISRYIRLHTLEDIMQSLTVNGPCLLGMKWWNNWSKDELSGYPVLDEGSGTYGGHAICIVGFDRTARMFKIRNSWGSSWGKRGYAFLTFDAVAEYAWDIWAVFDKPHPLMKK